MRAYAVASLFSLCQPSPAPTPATVDLRANQTAIRNQGSRNTCITFAAIAGLEAAYKRGGYGDLDLSEEFLNHTGKMFWLHPIWSEIPSAGYKENQIGAFGGGGGAAYIIALATGMRAVPETLMPYLPYGHTTQEFPELANVWYSDFWNAQLVADNYNLHPAALRQAALAADKTYSVAAYKMIDPKSARDIEAELSAGREVIWDFMVEGTQDPIWRTCREVAEGCAPLGGHAVLIVGYEKDKYFIIKNSWGRTSTEGADGFTYISYDYLNNGYNAASILQVTTPERSPGYGMMGRWQVTGLGAGIDIIDLYHLPGTSQFVFDDWNLNLTDRRWGTAYSQTAAYRLNGSIDGDTITLWLNTSKPNLRWDEQSGTKIVMTRNGNALLGRDVSATRVTDGALFRQLGQRGGVTREASDTVVPLMSQPYFPWALVR